MTKGNGSEHPIALTDALHAAQSVARSRGERPFVVGGVVRDLLLGRTAAEHDLDLVVEGDGIGFAQELSRTLGCAVKSHSQFLTAKLTQPFQSVKYGGGTVGESVSPLTEIDVATSRCEEYPSPGALPLVRPAPIEHDLYRRDFSMNAIALPLTRYTHIIESPCALNPGGVPGGGRSGAEWHTDLVDPCSGRQDLDARVVRILHDRSFLDDPTRLFRAIRYSIRFGCTFHDSTKVAFESAIASNALRSISTRRVWNEVVTILDESECQVIISDCSARGLFSTHRVISPEQLHTVIAAMARRRELAPLTAAGVISTGELAKACELVVAAGTVAAGDGEVLRNAQLAKGFVRYAATLSALFPDRLSGPQVDLSDSGRALISELLATDAAVYCIGAAYLLSSDPRCMQRLEDMKGTR